MGVFIENRNLNYLVISGLIVLLLQDQNRWQPWVFLYFIVLIYACSIDKSGAKDKANIFCIQLAVIAIYFYSGLHKLSPLFLDSVYKSILFILFKIQKGDFLMVHTELGYAIPLLEISIGMLLSFQKTRRLGAELAIFSHIFILIYLSPFGINENYIVFPWNLAMIFLVYFLFYGEALVFDFPRTLFEKIRVIPVVLIFWILPSLNFFGLWDNYLSFVLYAGRTNKYLVAISDQYLHFIDQNKKQFFMDEGQFKKLQKITTNDLAGCKIIDVNHWSNLELGVPFYPESRTFKQLAHTFCKSEIPDSQLHFIEIKVPYSKKRFSKYSCKDLN